MGAALYIALEQDIPGVDNMIDGKMLFRAETTLAETARRLGVRPLMDFISVSPNELADLFDEEEEGVEFPTEQWFAAAEGLQTIEALLGEVELTAETRAAQEDLLGFQRVLRAAQQQGVRWHLAADF